MASKTEEKMCDDFDGITNCTICLKPLTDSRMLPCVHTFCLSCLKDSIYLKQDPESKIKCPICQQLFEIPDGSCSNLKKNYFVDRLLEVKKISSMSESQCDVCVEERELSTADEMLKPAKFYCLQCQQKLCDVCTTEHKRHKMLKNHNLMTIGDIASRKQLPENALPSFCSIHSHEVVKMYCTSCEQVICMMCFAESHQSHSCICIKKAVDELRRSLDEVDDLVESVKVKETDLKARLDAEKASITEKAEAARSSIISRTKTLKELIESHKVLLLSALDSAEHQHKQEIETIEKEFNEAKKVMDTFLNYSDALKVNGSPGDICQSVTGLKSATQNYLEGNRNFIEPQLNPFREKFVATDMTLFEKNVCSIIGSLVPVDKGFTPPLPSEGATKPVGNQQNDAQMFGGFLGFSCENKTSDVAKHPSFGTRTNDFGFGKPTFNFSGGNQCTFGSASQATDGGSAKNSVENLSSDIGKAPTQVKLIDVKENIAKQLEKKKRSEIRLTSVRLVKKFESVESVCGVACLKEFVYILTPTCILTHANQLNFDLVKTIMLPPEIDIKDRSTGGLTASEGANCLYLHCGNTVWKLTAGGDQAELWKSCTNQVTSISANTDGAVLLGIFKKQDEADPTTWGRNREVPMRAMLCVFASNRKLRQKFLMSDNKKSIHQAIFASNGNIIISYTGSSEVLEMNMQGVICRSYQYPTMCGHQLRVDCVAKQGTGLFIGYVSNGSSTCCNKLIAINSDFQMKQVILPSTNYNIASFNYISFNNNNSQLLTVTSNPSASYNPIPYAINVLCILNA